MCVIFADFRVTVFCVENYQYRFKFLQSNGVIGSSDLLIAHLIYDKFLQELFCWNKSKNNNCKITNLEQLKRYIYNLLQSLSSDLSSSSNEKL